MKTLKSNVRYIVVHSTKTLPSEMYISVPYHYIVHRSGKIERSKKLTAADACIQIAYLGGISKDKQIHDTRTDIQNEALFNQIISLTEKFPEAKVVGADEVFGERNHPGFDVKKWLKNYTPNIVADAA